MLVAVVVFASVELVSIVFECVASVVIWVVSPEYSGEDLDWVFSKVGVVCISSGVGGVWDSVVSDVVAAVEIYSEDSVTLASEV